MSADGSGTRRLTSTKDDDAQPDLVARRQADRLRPRVPRPLFVMDADGAGAHRVTDEEVEETEPAWSPDGRSIAYVAERAGLEHPRALARAAPTARSGARLTKLGGVAQAPSWSPDGRRIAFSANSDDNGFDIYTVGADGKDVRLMTSGDDCVRAGLVARRQDDRLLGGRSHRPHRRGER